MRSKYRSKSRCPPGVICIENITVFVILIVAVVVYVLYTNYAKSPASSASIYGDRVKNLSSNTSIASLLSTGLGFDPRESHSHRSPVIQDRPPVHDLLIDPVITSHNHGYNHGMIRAVPINIPTQPRGQFRYRQMGILTRGNGDGVVLPLMGRSLMANRSKWQYHTSHDRSGVRLPISNNGRTCSGEYGCDELTNGDTVYVEGMDDVFSVTIYENDDVSMRYIPMI